MTDHPVIGVIVDPASMGPDTRAAVGRITQAGFTMGARLVIDSTIPDPASPELINTQLQPAGPNPAMRKQSRDCKTAKVQASMATTITRHPIHETPVATALSTMAGHLAGLTTARTDIVVFSPLLRPTSDVNLADPTASAETPTALLDKVRRHIRLPDCQGWNVYLVHTGASDAPPSMEGFWRTFVHACGGQVVDYDSTLTQYPVTPTRRTPLPHSAPPGVTRVTTPPPPPPLAVTIADTVLFDTASAELSPGADNALTDALNQIRAGAQDAPWLTVTGFTDTVAMAAAGGNDALSLARARAVAAWLARHGIDPAHITAVGRGDASPIADNATAAGRATNRRVEITATASGSPS